MPLNARSLRAPNREPAARIANPAMLRDRVLWHEVVLGAVTLLFALTATFMGCAIAINGVACHGLMAVESRWAATLRVWDVTCNVLMALYANLHSCGQPLSLIHI